VRASERGDLVATGHPTQHPNTSRDAALLGEALDLLDLLIAAEFKADTGPSRNNDGHRLDEIVDPLALPERAQEEHGAPVGGNVRPGRDGRSEVVGDNGVGKNAYLGFRREARQPRTPTVGERDHDVDALEHLPDPRPDRRARAFIENVESGAVHVQQDPSAKELGDPHHRRLPEEAGVRRHVYVHDIAAPEETDQNKAKPAVRRHEGLRDLGAVHVRGDVTDRHTSRREGGKE
jgi:hypothetical protein